MEALKEWAVVCRALEQGRQTVLLRKGGILEYRQGFEVKHDRFLMFPTFEHQSKDHLQPDYAAELDKVMMMEGDQKQQQPAVAGTATPMTMTSTVRLTSYAEAKEVREVTNRSVLKGLEKFHIWNETYVNARMDYNPAKPMSVILLRVFRLQEPIEVQALPEWSGCRSWVPLNASDSPAAEPAMSDSEFDKVASQVREVLSIEA